MSKQGSKSQKPLAKEDMYTYIEFLLTNKVNSKDHARELKQLSRRLATFSDVTVLYRILEQQQEQKIASLVEAVQIQQQVLEKLGATDDMFKEAHEEYNKLLEKVKKNMEEEQKEEKTDE